MLTAKELQRRLLSSGLASETDIRPCSDDDIAEVQASLKEDLPASYLLFLKTIGRGAGHFMSDLSIFFPAVLQNTDAMRDALREDGVELPPDAFVFADRYGEQMLFFQPGKSKEPPIYRWSNEEPTEFCLVFDSLWAFIEAELDGHEYMMK